MSNRKSYIVVKVPVGNDGKSEELVKALGKRFGGFEIRTEPSSDHKFRVGEVFVAKGDGVTDREGNEVLGGAIVQGVGEVIYRLTGDYV